jgi:hypothetical protein
MADIFISYANEDRETAARLAGLLESAGWSVWWDRRIPAGRTWRSVLQEALKDMRCMIALWSKDSVESPWVAEEAEEARRLGKTLVPILIQRVEPPIGFRAIQAADLANWNGSVDDAAIKMLIADLQSVLGAPSIKAGQPKEDFVARDMRPQPSLLERLNGHWPKAAIGAVALVALIVVWQKWKNPEAEKSRRPARIEEKVLPPVPAPHVTSLRLQGERKEIKPSETIQLSVTANYSDGKQDAIREGIEWASSDPKVAIVNDQGEVRGLRSGSTTITAKSSGAISPGWTLSVKAPEPPTEPVAVPKLVSVSIVSNRNELFAKEKISIRAKGKYSDSSEKYLSSGIDWESSDRTIASITNTGQLEGLRPGKVQVLARSGQLRSAPLAIVVQEPPAKPQPPIKLTTPSESQPTPPPQLSEQSKARISGYINRAKSYREQGNYAGALAELERAKVIDASNEEVRTEIEQTRRACNAEKVLGNKPNC